MRSFVGVWPPQLVRAAVEAAPRPDEPGVRWTAPHRWHVTLAFFWEVPDDEQGACIAALRSAAEVTEPPEARLGPTTSRLGRAVLCVPVTGLEGAAAAVRRAALDLGLSFDQTPFVGHLTLARPRGRARTVPARLEGLPLAAQWSVNELCLVASRSGPQGGRYETLATATLG